jgi:tRNA-specific 2-thiouridylase
MNWISGEAPESTIRVRVQVRHRHAAALADVEAISGGQAMVRFDEPVRAVAPGQAAVFYDADRDEEVLGGGWIAEGIR